jgi:hypothetical protein
LNKAKSAQGGVEQVRGQIGPAARQSVGRFQSSSFRRPRSMVDDFVAGGRNKGVSVMWTRDPGKRPVIHHDPSVAAAGLGSATADGVLPP